MRIRICIIAATLALGGCSATSLRCSIDGDSSFVELINLPQDISSQSRNFKDLCAFAYESEPDVKLNIIDQEQ